MLHTLEPLGYALVIFDNMSEFMARTLSPQFISRFCRSGRDETIQPAMSTQALCNTGKPPLVAQVSRVSPSRHVSPARRMRRRSTIMLSLRSRAACRLCIASMRARASFSRLATASRVNPHRSPAVHRHPCGWVDPSVSGSFAVYPPHLPPMHGLQQYPGRLMGLRTVGLRKRVKHWIYLLEILHIYLSNNGAFMAGLARKHAQCSWLCYILCCIARE